MKLETNNNQKILVAGTALIFVAIIVFSSWSINEPSEVSKLDVLATFYPLAYFAEEIGGDYISVTQLIPDNTEVHSWQPKMSDILATEEADIILINGVGLDHWMDTDILSAINTENKTIVETTENLTLLEINKLNNNSLEHGHELHDPHTWISPYIAKQQAKRIYEAFVQKDPDNEQYYTERWQNLKARFEQLDTSYMTGLSNTQKDTIFVTHAAFGYLAYRYGFEHYGVIGLSADEQPSASAIAELVGLMLEHEIFVVYVDPMYSDKYAETLKATLEDETSQTVQILSLYFMLGSIDNLDYFEQQESNLASLKTGLEAS